MRHKLVYYVKSPRGNGVLLACVEAEFGEIQSGMIAEDPATGLKWEVQSLAFGPLKVPNRAMGLKPIGHGVLPEMGINLVFTEPED